LARALGPLVRACAQPVLPLGLPDPGDDRRHNVGEVVMILRALNPRQNGESVQRGRHRRRRTSRQSPIWVPRRVATARHSNLRLRCLAPCGSMATAQRPADRSSSRESSTCKRGRGQTSQCIPQSCHNRVSSSGQWRSLEHSYEAHWLPLTCEFARWSWSDDRADDVRNVEVVGSSPITSTCCKYLRRV
jgi:hypothetical protein